MTVVRALRLLEIERGVSLDEMRQSYRDLVRVWHPDRFEGDPRLRAKAAARLTEINEAYRLLQVTGTDQPTPSPRSAPSSMPDRRKTPRPAPAAKRSTTWAGYAVAGAIVLTVLGVAGVPRLTREPAQAAATPVAVSEAPRAGNVVPAAAPPVTKQTPPPSVPAKSPFSRDLDRVLARTQSSVR